MKPYKHQVELALEAYKILKEYFLVYIAAEERTGKTLSSLLIAKNSNAKNILVLTKKKALDGWEETLRAYFGSNKVVNTVRHSGVVAKADGKKYTVTNYHQAAKLTNEYDLIILDEAHSYLSAYPKVGKIWKDVVRLTLRKPIIYLSATPYAQGYQLVFNQLRLSSWTPLKYKNFYDFHRAWGIPDKTRTPYGLVETYSKVRPEIWNTIKHLFITKTRKELDFEHEPTDSLRYFELSPNTKQLYNNCMKKEMLIVHEKGIESPLDSPMKVRTTLHMLEGGVAKVDDEYYVLDNQEKIDAIKTDFGDVEDLVIMYNYIAEGKKLKEHFKHATILQGTSYAEGIDLSGFKHLVIYSQDFSTARHSQRRARQANKKRDTPIEVIFYLVKDAISEQVYKTVSKNKTNFIDSLFERKEL